MLQPGTINKAFNTYWDDMEKCRAVKAFWSLLHVIVCLPDICAALQSKNGKSSRELYTSWCNQFLQHQMLSGAEMYRMRCKVLHQGRSKTDQPGRYSGFLFGQPSNTGFIDHNRVANGFLNLDVDELAREIRRAVEHWITDIESNPSSKEAIAVEKNLGSLVRVSRVPVPAPTTTPQPSMQSVIINKTN